MKQQKGAISVRDLCFAAANMKPTEPTRLTAMQAPTTAKNEDPRRERMADPKAT